MNNEDDKQREGTGRRWSPGVVLLLVMLLAAGLRVAVIVVARPMIQFDETAYVRMAENLARGEAPYGVSGLTTTHFTLLLPLFIAAVAAVVRDFIASGYVVATAFWVLVTVPVYLLGREFFGTRAGLMAAALAAALPIFFSTSEYIYTEPLYLFFMLSAAFFAWRMLTHRRLACAALAGVALGFAYLANPLAVYYLVAFSALAAGALVIDSRRRPRLAQLGLMLLLFAVVAAPYVIYLHHELGRWTYTGKQSFGYNFYAASHGLERGTPEWERDVMGLTADDTTVRTLSGELDADLLSVFLASPVWAGKVFAEQGLVFYREVLYQVFPLWLLPLLGLGLFAAAWDRARWRGNGFLLLLMLPALPVTAMLAFPRFYMPYLPMLLTWTAVGWQRLERWGAETVDLCLRGWWHRRLRPLVPWLVGAAVLIPMIFYGGATALEGQPDTGYREAGTWIESHWQGDDRPRVMSNESAAYYAGGILVPMPYADYRRTTHYARIQGVNYLVATRNDLAVKHPELALLLDAATRPREWRLENVVHTAGGETYIFRLE